MGMGMGRAILPRKMMWVCKVLAGRWRTSLRILEEPRCAVTEGIPPSVVLPAARVQIDAIRYRDARRWRCRIILTNLVLYASLSFL